MNLLNKFNCHLLVAILMILFINLTSCHMQEASTTAPVTQTHWQRPAQTQRNTVTRWKAVGVSVNKKIKIKKIIFK